MSRAKLYGRSQVVVGDRTSHGGVVLNGSPTHDWHGIPIARQGDRVFCPRCPPFEFMIAEGLENCTDTDAGLPMAVEGHKTTCGATLIARPASPEAMLVAKSLIDPHDRPFNEQVMAIESASGKALAGIHYFIQCDNGTVFHGVTDSEGKCPRIGMDEVVSFEIWFGIAAIQKTNGVAK
jgi:uncharacterized Zn-binding protein involved in type VI secretion